MYNPNNTTVQKDIANEDKGKFTIKYEFVQSSLFSKITKVVVVVSLIKSRQMTVVTSVISHCQGLGITRFPFCTSDIISIIEILEGILGILSKKIVNLWKFFN